MMPPANLRRILIVSGCIWAAGFVALKACGAFGAEMPPKRFREPGEYLVRTWPRDQLAEACAAQTLIPNTASRWNEGCLATVLRMVDGKLVPVEIVYLPNPCEVGGEWFARLTCEEQAHRVFNAQGQRWSAAHER